MKRWMKLWNLAAVTTLTLPALAARAQEVAAAAGGEAPAAAAEAPMGGGSMYQIIFGGGFSHAIAFILLIITSVAILALIIDGVLTIKRTKLMPAELVDGVREALNRGDLNGAVQTCEGNPGALSRILLTAFSNIQEGYEVIQEAVASSAEYENEKLIQRINYLNVCGQLGPMIGLFGTVMGMISAFAGLGAGAAGAAKTGALASGISTALWTTVLGIGVAIPALFAFVVIKNNATRLILEMQHTVLDLIKVLRTAEVEQQ